MSLQHILLGMLDQPASGYDLKKEFNQSLAHFWAAELSQIYPLLSRMEKDGLLTSRRSASEKGPPRKTYQRTAMGTRSLKKWLSDGPVFNEERRHNIAQVFFLSALNSKNDALAFMTAFRTRAKERLAALQAVDSFWKAEAKNYPDGLSDKDFYPQMTLDLGIRITTTQIEWCNEQIRRMKRTRR